MLEFIGTLTQVTPVQNVGTNGAQKRFIIVHEDGAYPKDVAFELYGKNIGLADNIAIGSKVRVCFDVKSREWQGRWFSDISAYRVELATNDVTTSAPASTSNMPQATQQATHSAPVMSDEARRNAQQVVPQDNTNYDLPF